MCVFLNCLLQENLTLFLEKKKKKLTDWSSKFQVLDYIFVIYFIYLFSMNDSFTIILMPPPLPFDI